MKINFQEAGFQAPQNFAKYLQLTPRTEKCNPYSMQQWTY